MCHRIIVRFCFVAAIAVIANGPVFAQTESLQDFAGQLARPTDATTVYVAKEFITIDPKNPRAQAVAVRSGRFVAVGTLDDVQAAAGTGAKVDRTFDGKVVIAGFVEQHVHPVLAALTMNTKVISIEDWDAIDGFSPAVRDPQGYGERLKQALADHKDKTQPFVTWGYHHYMHGEMSRTLLNQLAPDFAVIVWHRSGHELILNDAALKLTGIDEQLIASLPMSAQEQIHLEKGHFFEQGAISVLGKVAPFMASPASFKNGLEYSVKYYHRNGITVCCEPGGFVAKPVQDAINSVYSGEDVPFNHFFMADGKTFAARNPKDPQALIKDSEEILNWGQGRTAYLPKQVKLFTDGAIFSQLMQMKDGYTDGHKGAWIIDPPVFSYAFQSYWDAGFQIHVHNNGDAGFDVVLGELEKAMKRAPRQDHRTVLVHFGFAQQDQVKKWIELGGIVSSNPYYVTALAGPYEKIGIGPDRAKNIAPHKYVLDQKGSLSFHSDMPMAPAKPMQLVWAAVNRTTYEGQTAGPEHRVPLDIAIRAITINAAYSIQQEKEIGSIEVGKRANLTVLEQSPYDVPADQLKDIIVWGTMLEGRVQPVTKPEKTTSRRDSPRTPDQEAILARYAARVGEGVTHTPATSACPTGCSCQLSQILAKLIVTQLDSQRP
ncbi:MAG: amidohydrolase [Planctomycetaceae bacterium]